jgi:hypothetical protein
MSAAILSEVLVVKVESVWRGELKEVGKLDICSH